MTTNAIWATRPAPLPLFDPAVGEVPPADAVELYFEAPLSVGLFHMHSTLGGREDHVAAIDEAIEAAMSDVLACLHDHALLKVGYHAQQRRSAATVGEYQAGQLYLTRVSQPAGHRPRRRGVQRRRAAARSRLPRRDRYRPRRATLAGRPVLLAACDHPDVAPIPPAPGAGAVGEPRCDLGDS